MPLLLLPPVGVAERDDAWGGLAIECAADRCVACCTTICCCIVFGDAMLCGDVNDLDCCCNDDGCCLVASSASAAAACAAVVSLLPLRCGSRTGGGRPAASPCSALIVESAMAAIEVESSRVESREG